MAGPECVLALSVGTCVCMCGGILLSPDICVGLCAQMLSGPLGLGRAAVGDLP